MKETKMTQKQQTKFAFFALVRTLPAWLALPRTERQKIWEQQLGGVIAKYSQVSIRTFDAEAFATVCTDIILFETHDIEAYYFLIEEIRDSIICTHPYFEFVNIIPTIEEGFIMFEQNENLR